MTRYLSQRASCLQTQTHHLIIHDYIAVIEFYCLWHVCQCLIVSLLLGVMDNLLRFVLSINFYKSFHEWIPHFLCLRHIASLDDITHFAKFSRLDLCGSKGNQWIDCQTSKLFLQQNYICALYRIDVKVYSGLVSLYMQFDIHSCETSLSTLRSQAWLEPRDLVVAFHGKISPMIPLDFIKTLCSVA